MISSFTEIYKYIPSKLAEKIKKAISGYPLLRLLPDGEAAFVTELRLRSRRLASLTLSDGRNIPLEFITEPDELACVIARLTENSLHSHTAAIKRGYIALPEGCRVGVCGKAVLSELPGRTDTAIITNIGEITSVNIRIAHRISGCSDGIFSLLRNERFAGGVLFYGAPCSGKTTLLRELAVRAASGDEPMRVSVIDSRGEFRDHVAMKDTLIDLLDSYPKAEGIEQATRTLSPELLVCDEIGGYPEAQAILSVQNTGVPLLASAHARSLPELLRRPPLRLLCDNRVFKRYIGITRDETAPGGLRFETAAPDEPLLCTE